MKLEKTTVLLMAIAVLSVLSFSLVQSPSNQGNNSPAERIFEFNQDVINHVTIITRNQTIELERIDPFSQGNRELTNWQMTKPKSNFAQEAIVVYLLDLVNRRSRKTFTIDRSQLVEYGLDQPFGEIQFKLSNNTQQRIILGNTDYTQNNIYALINSLPTTDSLVVNLVPIEFKYAIDRPLEEWILSNN
jgi:hypothetical protein